MMAAELDRRKFLKLSFSALAATTLPLQQIGWLTERARATENIGKSDFEKYIVTEINKLPERKVGRIVKIETINLATSFGTAVRGVNINVPLNKARFWSFTYDPKICDEVISKGQFIKDMAQQLRVSFMR